MRVLIDGDVLSYRVAFSAKDEDAVTACNKMDELIRNLKEFIDPFKLVPTSAYSFYLTGKGNFRHDVAKTALYKGNRKDVERPQHLHVLRQYLVDQYDAEVSDGVEADDLIATAAAKELYNKVLIVSTDKDFNQLPVSILNPTKMEITVVSPWEATKNFYMQILTGDRVDNILGIHGIGPIKAAATLEGCDSPVAMYWACVEAYRHVCDHPEDRVLENAQLLWLRRFEGQMWEPPIATA
jgi:5'-3' exonuclease